MSLDIDRCLVDILIPSGVNLEKLSRIIDEYQRLIDTNLLWVRSDKPVTLSEITRLMTVVKQIKTHPVADVVNSFWNNVKARSLPYPFFLITLAFALPYRFFIHKITWLSSLYKWV